LSGQKYDGQQTDVVQRSRGQEGGKSCERIFAERGSDIAAGSYLYPEDLSVNTTHCEQFPSSIRKCDDVVGVKRLKMGTVHDPRQRDPNRQQYPATIREMRNLSIISVSIATQLLGSRDFGIGKESLATVEGWKQKTRVGNRGRREAKIAPEISRHHLLKEMQRPGSAMSRFRPNFAKRLLLLLSHDPLRLSKRFDFQPKRFAVGQ
jgi:hypothetical protein